MSVAPFLLGAYLLGAFPTSYLYGRLRGHDLRELGSGNLGATNVYRTFGAPGALLVVCADLAKGFVPTWFFPLWDGPAAPEWALAYGFLAIAGHVWSVFTGFSGGKGVATAAGALLALAPLAVLVGAMVWLGLALITRFASLASLVAASLVPVVAHVAAARGTTVLFAAALAAVVWITHRENVGRLLRGEELRLGAPGEEPPGRRRGPS